MDVNSSRPARLFSLPSYICANDSPDLAEEKADYATKSFALAAVACSPIGWVAVPCVVIFGVVANGVISLALLASGNGVMIKSQWRTYYRSIALCFTCFGAFAKSKKHYEAAKVDDVTAEDFAATLGRGKKFMDLLGWIGHSYGAQRRYDEEDSDLKCEGMESPIAGDGVCATCDGADCRMAPSEMTVGELDEMGIAHETFEGGNEQMVRPVIIWFDGTRSSGNIWQCAMNLCGAVPPIVEESYAFAKERMDAIAAHNGDGRNAVKLVPIIVGHSMGEMIGSAIAAKAHCSFIGLNGLGIGEGLARDFIGDSDMEWAKEHGGFLSLVAAGDATSDPAESAIYRQHIGRILRISKDEGSYGHYDYGEMLSDCGCKSSAIGQGAQTLTSGVADS
ncbi:MAG: hypothetical protein LBI39_02540 [Puniceicoccales bacterium]|nr:hypothetical protein [Puniceicoccales bacterium]